MDVPELGLTIPRVWVAVRGSGYAAGDWGDRGRGKNWLWNRLCGGFGGRRVGEPSLARRVGLGSGLSGLTPTARRSLDSP